MTESPLYKPRSSRIVVVGNMILALVASGAIAVAIVSYLTLTKATQPSSSTKASVVASKPTSTEAVAAEGRLEPQGEVINLSAPNLSEGARVDQLLVKVGDKVQARQAIAILDNRDRLFAELQKSQTQVKVAEARLVQMRSQKFMKPILIKFVSIAPLVKK